MPLSDAEAERIVTLRTSLGLNADPAFVRGLYADPSAHAALRSDDELLLGLMLTPEEADRVLDRRVLERSMEELPKFAEERLGDAYAGAYVANGADSRGEIHLLSTRQLAASEKDVIGAATASDVAGRVVFDVVPYTEKELQAKATEIFEALASEGRSFAGTAVDILNTRLIVAGDSARAQEFLAVAEAIAGGIPVVFEERAIETVQSSYLKSNQMPGGSVWAGLAIARNGSGHQYDCTSSIAATNPVFGGFLLTAGHCGGNGTTWSQGGRALGTMSSSIRGGGVDAGAISTTLVRGLARGVHRTMFEWLSPTNYVAAGDWVGLFVCHVGATSTQLGTLAPFCGPITNTWACSTADGFPYGCGFREANVGVRGGDSGGLVYADTGFGRAMVGIMHAGYNCSPTGGCFPSLFGYLPTALQRLNVTDYNGSCGG